MDERAETGDVGELEATAIALIRRARRSCEHLGDMGYTFVGVADWLEVQVPRVSAACREAMWVAVQELVGPAKPGDDD